MHVHHFPHSLLKELKNSQRPDAGLCLGSESIKARSKSRRSKSGSGRSYSQTIEAMEAEVEVAAFQEILAVMEEQEREAAELQKLEHENLERQQAMEKQCREIECLEEVKKLNATRAKAKVYEEGERTGMFSNKSPLKLLNKQFVGTHRNWLRQ